MMKRFNLTHVLACTLVVLFMASSTGFAATEQAKQEAIDKGLAWLASTQYISGSEIGAWPSSHGADGYVAATASAALAFIGEGYLPNHTGTAYEQTVAKAVDYVFSHAAAGVAYYGGPAPPSGTIFFNADSNAPNRTVYTTGVVTPVVYALGKALGKDATVNSPGSFIHGKEYDDVMQGVMDWYTWGQNANGGWQYYPNSGSSDNSTAQWGALPYLYGNSWGLSTPASVKTGLANWTGTVQNTGGAGSQAYELGGSGYSNPNQYVNMAKTGGMLLEFAAMGLPRTDPRVVAALNYMDSMTSFDHWNQAALYNNDQWYGGHLNNPYAMWAVFKGLETYNGIAVNDNGTPLDDTDDFLIGDASLISTAPGGITIGQDWNLQTSAAGDWYSHYSQYLVDLQNGNGSWSGYAQWTGAMATGWYINILNAQGAPEPIIPAPGAFLLGAMGLGMVGWMKRRKKEA